MNSTAEPDLVYEGRTPFVAYTGADVLHELVRVNTDEPLEVTFVVTTQIMELHFRLLRHEWELACSALAADDLDNALAALRRSLAGQRSLLASWSMLEPMSPTQYNRFRDALGHATGFQSFGFREIEFLLGAKDPRMLRPHAEMPAVAARLQALHDAPSVYDQALAWLGRQGLPVSPVALVRSGERPVDADLVEAWRQAYVRGGPFEALAESLTAVAEHHTRWRFVHYSAVQRILGTKPGTGGSAGLTWLKRAVDTPVFPELWEVRGVL